MKNLQSGQSLFELVVAIAISALVIVAIVSLVTNALRSATFSKNNAAANALASQAVEWLRSERDNDISVFLTNASTPYWCFANLDWTTPGICAVGNQINSLFTREGNFQIATVSGKTIIQSTIKVTWTDSQGDHEINNSTDFTDWRQR